MLVAVAGSCKILLDDGKNNNGLGALNDRDVIGPHAKMRTANMTGVAMGHK